MKHEKSCGAAVYALKDGERLWLVENMRHGHFALPKGHVEAGETEEETARREILEETGLTVELDTGFREETRYSPARGIMKTVVFFTAFTGSMDARPQPEEVESLFFLPIAAALRILTYDSDRGILKKAEEYVSKKRDKA